MYVDNLKDGNVNGKCWRMRKLGECNKVGSPLKRAKPEMEKVKAFDHGKYCDNGDRTLIPPWSVVCGIFDGNTLKYAGRALDLKDRLRQHLDSKISKTLGRIVFGSYSWYLLHPKQIFNTEDFLIRYYEPTYDIINDKRRE